MLCWIGGAAAILAATNRSRDPHGPSANLDRANARGRIRLGLAINLPGPFYLLALGDIAAGGHSTTQQIGLIILFNANMFVLVEVPLAGHIARSEQTAERVASFRPGSTPTGCGSWAGSSAQSASA